MFFPVFSSSFLTFKCHCLHLYFCFLVFVILSHNETVNWFSVLYSSFIYEYCLSMILHIMSHHHRIISFQHFIKEKSFNRFYLVVGFYFIINFVVFSSTSFFLLQLFWSVIMFVYIYMSYICLYICNNTLSSSSFSKSSTASSCASYCHLKSIATTIIITILLLYLSYNATYGILLLLQHFAG